MQRITKKILKTAHPIFWFNEAYCTFLLVKAIIPLFPDMNSFAQQLIRSEIIDNGKQRLCMYNTLCRCYIEYSYLKTELWELYFVNPWQLSVSTGFLAFIDKWVFSSYSFAWLEMLRVLTKKDMVFLVCDMHDNGLMEPTMAQV